MLDLLLESGIWPSVKQRPLISLQIHLTSQKVFFVSSFDSSPLAPDYAFILSEQMEQVQIGLNALNLLAEGKVHLSSRPNSDFFQMENVKHHTITAHIPRKYWNPNSPY